MAATSRASFMASTGLDASMTVTAYLRRSRRTSFLSSFWSSTTMMIFSIDPPVLRFATPAR